MLGERDEPGDLALLGVALVQRDLDARLLRIAARHLARLRVDDPPRRGRRGVVGSWLDGVPDAPRGLRQALYRHLRAVEGERRIGLLLANDALWGVLVSMVLRLSTDCGGKKIRVRRCIWTDGTTNPVFVPLVRIDSNAIANVKVSYDLDEKTGIQLQVRRAKRGSNDGINWGGAVEYGAAYSGSIGWSYAASYEITDVGNEFNEFGVNVKNAAGGAIELAWVTYAGRRQEWEELVRQHTAREERPRASPPSARGNLAIARPARAYQSPSGPPYAPMSLRLPSASS